MLLTDDLSLHGSKANTVSSYGRNDLGKRQVEELKRACPHPNPKVCGRFEVPRSPKDGIGVIDGSQGPAVPGIAKVRPKTTTGEIARA